MLTKLLHKNLAEPDRWELFMGTAHRIDPRACWGSPQVQQLFRQLGDAKLDSSLSMDSIIKESIKFVLHHKRFEFFCDACDANGNDWPIGFRLTHVYLGNDPADYAKARLVMLKTGNHPLFLAIGNWTGKLGNLTDVQFERYQMVRLPYRRLDTLTSIVWNGLTHRGIKGFERRFAFSLIMCVAECRLLLVWAIKNAEKGMLSKKWIPCRIILTDMPFDTDKTLGRTSLLKPSTHTLARFTDPADIKYCVPLYPKLTGRFLSIANHCIEFITDLPSYFVVEGGRGWKLYLSDAREYYAQYVGWGRGAPEKSQEQIMDRVAVHITNAVLCENKHPSLLSQICRQRFCSVRFQRMNQTEQIAFFKTLLNLFDKKVQGVFNDPRLTSVRRLKGEERNQLVQTFNVLGDVLDILHRDEAREV